MEVSHILQARQLKVFEMKHIKHIYKTFREPSQLHLQRIPKTPSRIIILVTTVYQISRTIIEQANRCIRDL